MLSIKVGINERQTGYIPANWKITEEKRCEPFPQGYKMFLPSLPSK